MSVFLWTCIDPHMLLWMCSYIWKDTLTLTKVFWCIKPFFLNFLCLIIFWLLKGTYRPGERLPSPSYLILTDNKNLGVHISFASQLSPLSYSQAPRSRLVERFLEQAGLWYIPDHIVTVSYVDRWPRGTLNRQRKLSFFLGKLSDQHWQYLFFFRRDSFVSR